MSKHEATVRTLGKRQKKKKNIQAKSTENLEAACPRYYSAWLRTAMTLRGNVLQSGVEPKSLGISFSSEVKQPEK